jgi:FkbM family methyltransferase
MSVFSLKQALGIELPTIQILDVGAMMEGTDRYQVLRDMGLARVTGFEPDEQQYRKLISNKAESDQYFPHFLGTGERQSFNLARYPGCSSLYEPDPAAIDLFTSIGTGESDNFRVLKTVEIETRRLDDIAECPAPDLIKIDVQGAELDILKHACRALESALVIESEVEFIPLYRDQPLFGDLQVYLRDHGLQLHKLIDIAGRSFRPFKRNNNEYAATSQVLWADAIFVRDFTRLERFSDEELLKTSLILHQVYCSYDLVHLLLGEHDQRRSTGLAKKYLTGLQSATSLPVLYMNLKEHI